MDYNLEDLVDFDLYAKLLKDLNRICGFSTALVTPGGHILLKEGWQQLCTRYHRNHPVCEKGCMLRNPPLSGKKEEHAQPRAFLCPHGLTFISFPLMLEKKLLGTLISGQVFMDEPRREYFIEQAGEYGFDQAGYLKAVESVPRWTEDQMDQHRNLLLGFRDLMISCAAKEMETRRSAGTMVEENLLYGQLTEFAVHLAGISHADHLEQMIARQLKQLTGGVVVLFSEYLREKECTVPRVVEAESKVLSGIIELLGKRIDEFEYRVTDTLYRTMMEERVGVRKTLHEVSFGAVPRAAGKVVQSFLGVDRFIGIAYIVENELYGTSVVAMKPDQPDPPPGILESFASLAAVSLRRNQVEKENEQIRNSLRDLNRRYIELTESQFSSLSERLHYELGQSLTAVLMDAGWLEKKCTHDSQEVRKLREMISLLEEMTLTVQRISTSLHPAMLEEIGLGPTVEWYCTEFGKESGLEVSLMLEVERTSSGRVDLAIYRILQEALKNSKQHAFGSEISVSLYGDEGDLVLEVTDNGKGIEEQMIRSPKSLGILGMKERIRSLGGTLQIRRLEPSGTMVVARVPDSAG